VVLVIFLLATTKVFVWFGNNIVERHKAYESSRVIAGNGATVDGIASQSFFNQSAHQLHIFSE